MNEAILEFIGHAYAHIVLIAVATAALFLAMVVDLYYGIKKAKELGKATSSTGLKKTCEKARKYFSPYIVLILIDFMACTLIPVPAFSMLWAAFCIFCEFKSVQEKAWQKEELRNAEKTMNVIIENKDDIAKMVAAILFENEHRVPATDDQREPSEN